MSKLLSFSNVGPDNDIIYKCQEESDSSRQGMTMEHSMAAITLSTIIKGRMKRLSDQSMRGATV